MNDDRQSGDLEALLDRARAGDAGAQEELLGRYRPRLRKMLAMRMDARMAARVDASDVVQEALRVAHGRLEEYLEDPRRPFYAWLRGIALDRLVEAYRRHVVAQKRSVLREQTWRPPLNDESEYELANSIVVSSINPVRRVVLAEMQARVRKGLKQLSASDREMLVLRHLEQLSVDEIADVLGITKTAVTTRHLRALQRLRGKLGDEFGE